MKYYARIENNVVFEIICIKNNENITDLYHPDFIFIECDKSVQMGMIKDGKGFIKPLPEPELTIEQLREAMILTKLEAKLRLLELGLYTQINDAILAMSDCVLKVKWIEADSFKRTDADLVAHLNKLGMTDEQIDALFIGAVVQQ